MTQRTVNEIWAGASTASPTVRQMMAGAWATVMVWHQRASERRALRSLDDHFLKDVGLSRADVWQECRKPFWQE